MFVRENLRRIRGSEATEAQYDSQEGIRINQEMLLLEDLEELLLVQQTADLVYQK